MWVNSSLVIGLLSIVFSLPIYLYDIPICSGYIKDQSIEVNFTACFTDQFHKYPNFLYAHIALFFIYICLTTIVSLRTNPFGYIECC